MAPIAVDWVEYNARRFGDAPALQTAETRAIISWAELESLVAGLAGALRDTDAIGFGDRVAVLADNDVRFFVLQFACMRLGAIFVPRNRRLTRMVNLRFALFLPAKVAVSSTPLLPRT